MKYNPLIQIGLLAAALTLSACSSVRPNQASVEDRSPSASATGAAGSGAAGGVSAGAGSAAGTPTPSRTVTPVEVMPRAAAPGSGGGSSGSAAPPDSLPRVIYFGYDSFDITPEGLAVIDGHARFLNANKGRNVSIEGHTDERGGREYNLALGQKRAEAVRKRLNLLGVADSQVEAVSFGKEKPAVPGSTEAAYEKNRRAEIKYR